MIQNKSNAVIGNSTNNIGNSTNNSANNINYQIINLTSNVTLTEQNMLVNNSIKKDITIKRIDRVHPTISGNKFYKLKYNLQYAKEQGVKTIISFGGAYSNHIHALAHACNEYGFDSVGIIRGEELANKTLNTTLADAKNLGMQLQFISRQAYRKKDERLFLQELQQQYADAYIIPEGGSNELAIKGASEIISADDKRNFDLICCAVGTGGTISGIINASNPEQQVIGYSALNSVYQQTDIAHWTNKDNWKLYADVFFGGYARYDQRLLTFIEDIEQQFQLPLEPIYTGKALFRLEQGLQQGDITAEKILFIHTGGLQGNRS